MLHFSSTTTQNSTTGRRHSWTLRDVTALVPTSLRSRSRSPSAPPPYLAPSALRPAPSTVKSALKRPTSPVFHSSSSSPTPAPLQVHLDEWDAPQPESHSGSGSDSGDEPQSAAPIALKVRFDVPGEAASPPIGRWDDGVAWSDFMARFLRSCLMHG
ncbi:hypothetical protein C8R46DRAFT_1229661 [Mycena filopes]|nr:hypothetical protein C8R46DRAFT_1229661 [Mycena filopes]